MTSRSLDGIVGAALCFKCENFQRTGAFKMRGAIHAVLCLSDEERARGVVTHSSGNFAQALALAAQSLGIQAFVVMPSTAAEVKKEAVRAYGGEVIECKATLASREAVARRVEEQHGATFIHPSNDINVILGQGTAGLELLEDHPDLDYLFVPVGGGGLIAGCALAAHWWGSDCQTIGGEPFAVDDAFRSLVSGRIETNAKEAATIADGLKTQLGDRTFPIIQQHVTRVIRVDEEAIVVAMRLIWERMKIVVEPSGAVALAAVMREQSAFLGKQIGVVLSGGNVDLDRLPF